MKQIGAGTYCSIDPVVPEQKPITGIKATIIKHGFRHASNMDVINELAKRDLSVDEKLCVIKLIDNME